VVPGQGLGQFGRDKGKDIAVILGPIIGFGPGQVGTGLAAGPSVSGGFQNLSRGCQTGIFR
jgi:hypothetical protein